MCGGFDISPRAVPFHDDPTIVLPGKAAEGFKDDDPSEDGDQRANVGTYSCIS